MVLGPRLVSTASLTAGTANWGWSLCSVCVWWGLFCAAGRGATSLWALASADCGAMSKPMVGGGLWECSPSYRLWQGEDSQPEKALSLPLDGSGLYIPGDLSPRTSPSKPAVRPGPEA